MVFVEVRLHPMDLLSHMADMRIWLDSKVINAAGFSYNASACLAFREAADAEAFAARFSGRVTGRAPSALEPALSPPTALASIA